ncbi:glucose-1-phosphate adenylyltransferase subunit GlgD [Brevibacillus dissolubilis]|uniref:glucose-1-phosphate adenylyltransferase subunit GlgD n=1 Tax=Brevibacillus dissolubilis TaxID=1844116 RepID=UPI001116F8ED|nr:glucose-1-phosphate adenylyltransferase subunit GlgD [Brevibacillus dissolubilis]
MPNAIGVINLAINQPLLHELTYSRSTAAVPFGGRYRLIDFVLSNMVNCGVKKVAVFTNNNSRSLMDHLGSGKEWGLDRKQGGLFILPPSTIPNGTFGGDLQQFAANLDYFLRSKEKYVIISSSHMVCNIDFSDVMRSHVRSGADLTLIYKELNSQTEDLSDSITLDVGLNGRVRAMRDSHIEQGSNKVYMRMMVISKELLVDLVKRSVSQNYYDLLRHVIMRNLDRWHVNAYEYKGYLGIINSITNYYRNSMNLLKPENWHSLFFCPSVIYTKVKDEAPAIYSEHARVTNSLIANGCIVEGTVENSILFRGVKVHRGAIIRNSIIMQKCEIEASAILENVILDKEVHVSVGTWLEGEKLVPAVYSKKSVI